MPFPRSPTREVYAGLNLPRAPVKKRFRCIAIGSLFCVVALILWCVVYFRSLSSGTALSDARDMVTIAVSDTVNQIMIENDYGYGDFVRLEKDTAGNITAIIADTARINRLSAQVLSGINEKAESGHLDIRIPLGDLFGAGLLLGRGPEIPVKISMMTSSSVRFENHLVSTGINQSRHTLTLVADIDIDMLIPWGSQSTTVETEILIAETVIMGRVPDTYINVEDFDGND